MPGYDEERAVETLTAAAWTLFAPIDRELARWHADPEADPEAPDVYAPQIGDFELADLVH